MARSELADEVNRYLFSVVHKHYDLDRHQIARYERGEVRWPGAAYRAGLRAVLGAETDADLGFTPRKRAVVRTVFTGVGEVPPGWHPADVLATADEMTGEDVALSRRQALGAASATTGAAVTEPLQRWLAPAHSSFPGASAISDVELVGWQQIARQFHDWNKTPTGGLARKAVIAQLNELSDRLKEVSEAPTTRPAFLVGANLAEIAASMSWDAGLHRAAQRYYSLSVKFAKVAGDDTFAALTLASFARQCFDIRQPGDGLELVQLAQYGTRRSAGPRLRSLLATREAWSYAQTGAVQPFRRAAGLAEDHFAEEPSGTGGPVGGLDQAELFGVLGARWRDLAVASEQAKQARHAQEYIGRALALREPGSVRNRAFDLIGLARTHLITAEPDYACDLIETALPIAADWVSGRVGEKLRDFHKESQRFGDAPRVRATRDAVRDVITT
ncbi:hypothetical protein [Saccharopolyspora gloriosae]|uniref:hypothetical protein n=1 Tax=Saccharopolyspora gloriosae TaxID=455344 RepID=UPI001FB715BE|nr:hypothetical protein [Saccharopolyspora gloriosae]